MFNVHMCSFVCMCIHMGVGHTDESAQHFDSEKNLTNVSCAPLRVKISGLWILRQRESVSACVPCIDVCVCV